VTALLDNPIWHALTTHQRGFAEAAGDAARFAPAVTALAGLRAPTAAAQQDLATLLGDRERTGLFLDPDVAIDRSLVVIDEDEITQMIQPAAIGAPDQTGLMVLGDADVAEMIELTALTRPGPFSTRTHQLGLFLGVRDQGRLVAMAGQRMRLDGLHEISAVCTHPTHAGRGLGARLLAAQAARIHAAGAIPFLHVRSSNAGAIGLYRRLGFVERRRFRYVVAGRGATTRSAA
jgi:predicted GNAT family acetyltransferase